MTRPSDSGDKGIDAHRQQKGAAPAAEKKIKK